MSTASWFRWAGAACIVTVSCALAVACGGDGGTGDDNNNANQNNNLNVNSNDNGNQACSDLCGTAGETRCEGDWVQVCGDGANGCRDWLQVTDCTQSGQSCAESSSGAACEGACSDACMTAGDTQCLGTVVQTCELGTSGCLVWVAGTDCASNGERCDDAVEPAVCAPVCSPGLPHAPSNPLPPDGTTGLLTSTSVLDWDDATSATHYAVYLSDSCPPPTYPDPSFVAVSTSELTGVTLQDEVSYCWQAVSLDAADCATVGPVWTFTTACTDPVAGAPQVTSSDQVNPAWTTSGSYLLTFNEPVSNVPASLTWTPVVGTGTMSAPVVINAQSYSIPFSGVMPGDQYILTVGPTVQDGCGLSSVGTVQVHITVESVTGEQCPQAVDITGATMPVALSGTFDHDGWGNPSCDTSPTNTVWYTFTPSQSGVYEFRAQNYSGTNAYSRLALFAGESCSPLGTEVHCSTDSSRVVETPVTLLAGTRYVIAFYTDGQSYTMVDPTLSVTLLVMDPGETCATAVDVTNETFPFQVTGDYTTDPTQSSRCDPTPTNAVWFRYTPTVSGEFQIITRNYFATNASSRLAVFQASSCAAIQDDLDCMTTTGKIALLETYLTQGVDYYILFHTDSNASGLVDPEITINPTVATPGEYCEVAEDLSAVAMPYTASGTFSAERSLNASCGAFASNAYWFTYTPSETVPFDLDVNNAANDQAKLAVFQGAGCGPFGTELYCLDTASSGYLHLEPTLQAGVTYTFVYFTTSESDLITNPWINIQPWQPGPAEACSTAASYNSTSSTCPGGVCTVNYHGWSQGSDFPYEIPTTGPSCLATPYNIFWGEYTAPHDGWMRIRGYNTNAGANNGMALFAGTSCSPFDPEVFCLVQNDQYVRRWFYATAGVNYQFMYFTDDDTDPMSNPSVTIYPNEVRESGFDCANASDETTANHWGWDTTHRWDWSYDYYLTTSEHVFTCDADVGGGVVAEVTTGPAQTTLDFSVNISDHETGGALIFEIADSPCIGGASLLCIDGLTSRSGQIFVMPNTTYYLFVADREAGHRQPTIVLQVN